MASAKIFRINYKSDFILTLESDAGWMTPFCIKFWTGAPSQAYYVGWDGETYDHCSFDPSEPTKLQVQFDDHHLPIGNLKFQVAYHFTVADFPNDTEDEVLNQANITTEIDGETYQVMLDFTGETAPEIQFSLPAYANEAQRIANEQQRIAAETQRIANEETRIQHEESRIAAEQTRQQNEQQRINQEQARVNEYATLKADAVAATGAANDAAALANQKAQLAADKAALAQDAADLANAKAQLAADKAALADAAATLANQKAALAQQKAEYAQEQGTYSKNQGDYAKEQGDYSKAQGDYAKDQGDYSKSKGDYAKDQGDYSKQQGDYAKEQGEICAADHLVAVADHQKASDDHTLAAADHQTAGNDHTQAGTDHTRAESDHTRAESDHAAVEVFVDSLGAYDISAANAVGGVLAEYADLSAALAAMDDSVKRPGMSVKFVESSGHKYVQSRYMSSSTANADFANTANWQGVDDEPTDGSDNLVKSGGVFNTANALKDVDLVLESGKYYGSNLVKYNTSGWMVTMVLLDTSHERIRVNCSPRSSAYTSLVDASGNVLWQSNNAADFPKVFNFSDYPAASKLYISSETSKPDPSVTYIDTISAINEKLNDIIEGCVLTVKLNDNMVDGKYYKGNLELASSTSFVAQLIDITYYDSIKVYSKLRGVAAISVTDADDNILAQFTESNIPSTEFTISKTTYPTAEKLYFTDCKDLLTSVSCYAFGEVEVKGYYTQIKDVFDLKKITEKLASDYETAQLSIETKKIYSNGYNPLKVIQLPSQFDDFTIPINISYDNGVAGWDIDISAYSVNNADTATYFVSPDGSDSNSGLTASSPLGTIDAALNKSDVNTIILLSGEYINGIHFSAGLQVTKNINIVGRGTCVLKSNPSQNPLHIKNAVYVKNIVFDGGNAALKVTLTTETVAFYRCKFLNSGTTNGLEGVGGKYLLEECEASNNKRDGFNYHRNTVDNTNYNAQAVEINCCGYFNGIGHNSYINNGSTIHDYGLAIRIYCDYAFCKGGVVADADGASSFNVGVSSYCTQNIDGDDSRKSNFGAQNYGANMYLISCASFGSKWDCYSDNSCHVHRNVPFVKEGYTGTGTVENYTIQYKS